MAEANPERNLRVLLLISAVTLVTGAVVGGVGFGIGLGEEHVLLGARTGALLSQTVVWGGLIFVGVGHWVWEAVKEVLPQDKPSADELTLTVDPTQIDRPLEQGAPATAAHTPAKAKRLEEVSV